MRRVAFIFAGSIALTGGCVHDPQAAPGQPGAELRAAAGTTIVAIDDQHIASGDVVNNAEQIVRAKPGARIVHVYANSRTGRGAWSIPLTLEAGHVYRVAPTLATAVSMRVVDETSNRVLIGPAKLEPGTSWPAPPITGSGGPAGMGSHVTPPHSLHY
jgi:hypothetical protein